jgi:nicotinamide mononucleotide adenylyltransferase
MNDAEALFELIKTNKRRFELEAGAYQAMTIAELRRDIEQLKTRDKVPERLIEIKQAALVQAVDFYNTTLEIMKDYEHIMRMLKIQVILVDNHLNKSLDRIEGTIRGKW